MLLDATIAAGTGPDRSRLPDLSRPALVLAVVLLSTLLGCAPRGKERPRPDVVAIIDEVERAITARDFSRVHAQVDYRFRLEELLGDLWRGGEDVDRDDLVALAQSMFEDTSEKHRERFVDRPMERVLVKRSGPHVWVESRPRGESGFAWRYRLTRRGDTWAITVRDFKVSAGQNDSTQFWHMARKHLTNQFGRPLTLREFTANLPSVMGTFRARTFRIPALAQPRP
ncbi:MAG TPA: hypothetical protein PK095_19570 [Myxococcota bacterium]|nr:hypothetical protein [Myxococcota bacterium]